MIFRILPGLLLIVILSIAVPKTIIRDNQELTDQEIACAKRDVAMILENPIERTLIIETSIDGKEDGVLHASSYTLGGLKYATVDLVCNEYSTVTWRRWFGQKK